jgi:protease-4
LSPKQKEYAQQMLGEIHQQFIAVVKAGRGSRIKDSPELFSGLVWTGKRSIDLGLTDALGSVRSVARDVVKAEDIVDFTVQENVAERVARKFGAAMGRSFATTAGQSVKLR